MKKPIEKAPIESAAWVERELRRRSRSLVFRSVLEERQSFIRSKKKANPVTLVVSWRDGCWRVEIEDTSRRGFDSTTVILPRLREDRIRVLYAIAREYLT